MIILRSNLKDMNVLRNNCDVHIVINLTTMFDYSRRIVLWNRSLIVMYNMNGNRPCLPINKPRDNCNDLVLFVYQYWCFSPFIRDAIRSVLFVDFSNNFRKRQKTHWMVSFVKQVLHMATGIHQRDLGFLWMVGFCWLNEAGIPEH
jgi:hypothetical protein